MFKTIILIAIFASFAVTADETKKKIEIAYIPLADHYPLIIAYEKYRDKMKFADLHITQMKSWDFLRSYFREDSTDMAGIICPMAIDMFSEKADFRWVSLLHRDGNALAINENLNKIVQLPTNRIDRKPDSKVADAFCQIKELNKKSTLCGVPHILSTHTVVLYKYMKDYGKSIALKKAKNNEDVTVIEIAPPKSPGFLKKENLKNRSAAFEQSLPWADVVETGNYGKVAWYSKDVIKWPNGHVECILIAKDKSIANKREAAKEVIYYIHKAGLDIEEARKDKTKLAEIADIINKYIPKHNKAAIIQSLRLDLNVINYKHLNIDKEGLKQIMDLAVEGGILKKNIDINSFADDSFNTKITEE